MQANIRREDRFLGKKQFRIGQSERKTGRVTFVKKKILHPERRWGRKCGSSVKSEEKSFSLKKWGN